MASAKERPAAPRPKLAAFDASGEKDVAKREKIKAYNALLLKLAAADDPRRALAATPSRASKDTARSKDDSSGKKTAVKVRLATKATPGKNGPLPAPSKLSSASTHDELAKAPPPPSDKSPLRFNNVQLIEPKKPVPVPSAPPKKNPSVRDSVVRVPLKTPPPKQASPQKPAHTKATVKPPVPTLAQLRSQTPTPAASVRRVAAPKSPAPRPGLAATTTSAYRTPAKAGRGARQEQQAVKAAAVTLRLSALFSKSRVTQQSFALNRLKLDAQHCRIKEAFAEEFRDYSLKKRLFRAGLAALADAKKR